MSRLMCRLLASLSLLVPFASPASADEDAVLREREALRGFWIPVRYEQGLTLGGDPGFGDFAADVDADRWLIRYGDGEPFPWRFTPDPAAGPKRIDFEGTRPAGPRGVAGPDAAERYTRLGIYELDGDRLTLCFSAVEPVRAGRRPADFSAGPGSGRILVVFERGRPPEPEAPPALKGPGEPGPELGPNTSPPTAAPAGAGLSPAPSYPLLPLLSPGAALPCPCGPGVVMPPAFPGLSPFPGIPAPVLVVPGVRPQ